MTNQNHDPVHEACETPPELRAVEASLDDLARADRAEPSPGFEDRLQLLSAGRLRASTPRVVIFRRSWMAAAACLGVLISGWVIWNASRPASTPAAPESGASGQLVTALSSDLDAWLEESEDPLDASLDALFAQTSLLGKTLDSDWLSTEDLDSEEI
ncbi:MAG: hypothetical protein IT439_00045 [Phycisphaerales bacterium]|nr:hypothetical protein [Phycisphaerales bacterium]